MPSQPPAAATPTPRWQSVATALLLVHFFCLAVGLAVNVAGGRSIIGQSLRNVPIARQYLQLLFMDRSFDSPLAGAGPDDGVHRLQLLRGDAPPGADSGVIAELPDDAIASRIRRQRYQYLAGHVAYFDDLFDENSDLRTLLPLAIAERWTKAEALEPGNYVLRCLRLPSRRLPRAIAAEVTYAYVMREGGLQQQVVEKPPPDPINVFLVWDPVESHYQGSREAAPGLRSEVIRPAGAPPHTPN
jgi:hypothetical protein